MLEVIALDPTDAEAAQAGGADRLELVSEMAAGGLTPSVEVTRAVLAATSLPVRVMLRDQGGYRPADLAALRKSAAELRAAGATEFVLGFLRQDRNIDLDACRDLLVELDGCRWTFHRALDNSADPLLSWAEVENLGADTVLASGSPEGVDRGMPLLRELALRQEPLRLLVGGGLKREHVVPLGAAGVRAFHVGSAVRPDGWAGAVDVNLVREWAQLCHDGARTTA
ncbi:copper homeostasis protein CutC [Allokutzneria sp. A3M-2-11 16]|uniref:copper homeostasis protein CutC n=1 Tax=Allokutzneria sp. A3M-2-11 16 TaxID=2962043 RepID=UPI0020B70D0C|nr:copper homeostasis protein CutC [Allokutzneria sp. A3M-2-11 16]MCP3800064.1 copper homeostasis protein CutC [Allokutzneria sp. A3M-2-11 16]